MRKYWWLLLIVAVGFGVMVATTGCDDDDDDDSSTVVVQDGSSSSGSSDSTTILTEPAAPTLLSPKNYAEILTPTTLTLDWTDVDGATQYEVTVNPPGKKVMVNVSQIQWKFTNGGEYLWNVRAKNAAGYSDYSEIFMIKATKLIIVDI